MKVTKEHLQKIIKEELELMVQEGEIEEDFAALKGIGSKLFGDFKTKAGAAAGKLATKAGELGDKASAYGKELKAAGQEASREAAAKKLPAQVSAALTSGHQQVEALIDNFKKLKKSMDDAGVATGESGQNVVLVLKALENARDVLQAGATPGTGGTPNPENFPGRPRGGQRVMASDRAARNSRGVGIGMNVRGESLNKKKK